MSKAALLKKKKEEAALAAEDDDDDDDAVPKAKGPGELAASRHLAIPWLRSGTRFRRNPLGMH
jgi:hypothetical protein